MLTIRTNLIALSFYIAQKTIKIRRAIISVHCTQFTLIWNEIKQHN
jgi:hypothetical protein